jgi:septal ring factor EnvC (AmiA/AmiB activator)
VSNRERIGALEAELKRVRDRLHAVESEIAAFRFIGEKIGELGDQIKELATQVQTLSRRALERPTAGGVSAAAAWVSVLVAVGALATAALR